MEDSGILDVSNQVHMFTLHFVFFPRINQAHTLHFTLSFI